MTGLVKPEGSTCPHSRIRHTQYTLASGTFPGNLRASLCAAAALGTWAAPDCDSIGEALILGFQVYALNCIFLDHPP